MNGEEEEEEEDDEEEVLGGGVCGGGGGAGRALSLEQRGRQLCLNSKPKDRVLVKDLKRKRR